MYIVWRIQAVFIIDVVSQSVDIREYEQSHTEHLFFWLCVNESTYSSHFQL